MPDMDGGTQENYQNPTYYQYMDNRDDIITTPPQYLQQNYRETDD